jgi:hypothetical protein
MGPGAIARVSGGSLIEYDAFHEVIAILANLSESEWRSLDTFRDGDQVDTSRFLCELNPMRDSVDDDWKQDTSDLAQLVQKRSSFLKSLSESCDEDRPMPRDSFRQLLKTYEIDRETIKTAVLMFSSPSTGSIAKHCFEWPSQSDRELS